MNIELSFSSPRELKGYIGSQVRRCVAVGHYFSLFDLDESERTAGFTHYILQIAEMAEAIRLAQLALAQLIEIDGQTVHQFLKSDERPYSWDERVDDKSVDWLKNTFMGKMHFCWGQARYFLEWFDVMDDGDYNETYARALTELASIQEAILLVQLAYTHILRIDNQDRYRQIKNLLR